jgi:branched-chain amino acid transport system substrate-binding protein
MKTVLPILVLGAVLASSGNVLAQDKLVKIGVLTDLSGLYSDFTGQGSTLAAEMAIQDSGLNKKGWTVELV